MKIPWYLMAKGKGSGTGHASGPIAHWTDGVDAPLKSLLVNIDPVQEGTGDPSPDNVRPISGWSAVNVWRTGKNLYNMPEPSTTDGVTLSKLDNGKFELNGICESNFNFSLTINSTTIKKGTYTISFGNETTESSQTRCDVFLVGINSVLTVNSATVSNKETYTLDYDYTGNISYRIRVHAGVTYEHFVIAPQLELGFTATDYEPYSGNQYTIQLGQTVYGGTLTVNDDGSGTLVATHVKHSVTSFDGVFGAVTYGYCVYKIISGTTHTVPDGETGKMVSNIFGYSSLVRTTQPLFTYGGTSGANTTYTFILPASITSLDEANTWLSSNPTECMFYLATPITIQLTPTEITTLLGQNNVWADTGDVTVEYESSGGSDPNLMKLVVAFMGRR